MMMRMMPSCQQMGRSSSPVTIWIMQCSPTIFIILIGSAPLFILFDRGIYKADVGHMLSLMMVSCHMASLREHDVPRLSFMREEMVPTLFLSFAFMPIAFFADVGNTPQFSKYFSSPAYLRWIAFRFYVAIFSRLFVRVPLCWRSWCLISKPPHGGLSYSMVNY